MKKSKEIKEGFTPRLEVVLREPTRIAKVYWDSFWGVNLYEISYRKSGII